MGAEKTGLYVHIPFCVQKCNYCAFLSFNAEDAVRRRYAKALIREIEMRAEAARGNVASAKVATYDGHASAPAAPDQKPLIDTVYFGGGTPSIMDIADLSNIMESIKNSFDIKPGAEITLEANPGTLGRRDGVAKAKFTAYKYMGINRLSMGVQSMDNDRLHFLGRIHTAEDVARDFKLAREIGFDNINLDLIFSVPGETTENALDDARKIIELGPEHISCYSLQLEEGTPFYKLAESGEIQEIEDEEDRTTYHEVCKLLASSGYEHYEISNFARTGMKARHNSLYWDMSDYIGVGLGASGFINGRRYRNVSNLNEYTEMIEAGKLPEEADENHVNTAFDNISEAVFTGLRRKEGISYKEAVAAYRRAEEANGGARGGDEYDLSEADFGQIFWWIYKDAREEAVQFSKDGLLIIDDEGLRLTEKGIDVSNTVMACFV